VERHAPPLRIDVAFDDAARAGRLEVHALVAGLAILGLVLVLHGFLRCLLSTRLADRDEGARGGSASEHRNIPEPGATRDLRFFVHGDLLGWSAAAPGGPTGLDFRRRSSADVQI